MYIYVRGLITGPSEIGKRGIRLVTEPKLLDSQVCSQYLCTCSIFGLGNVEKWLLDYVFYYVFLFDFSVVFTIKMIIFVASQRARGKPIHHTPQGFTVYNNNPVPLIPLFIQTKCK